MPFPYSISFTINELYGAKPQTVTLYSGLTSLIGPNGSGKSQVLRALKERLSSVTAGRIVRDLSAGRLFFIEQFRTNFDGQRGAINYDGTNYGGKQYRSVRHKAETAYGDFHTLSIRPDIQIKVAERLRRLFHRDVNIEYDAGNLRLVFSRLDTGGGIYQSSREASGLLQLVTILTALYDDEVGALLLDEPEVSLHPQLQAFLLHEILGIAGDPADNAKKIVVIATHSTEMIDIQNPQDLCNIIFLTAPSVPLVQISRDAGELQGTKIQALLPRLGQAHKAAFFCARPLLVEGPSDAIMCNALDQRLSLYLNVGGSSIVPITGKGQMPVVSKLMRLAGKTPIVLADLDAVADGMDFLNTFAQLPEANEAARTSWTCRFDGLRSRSLPGFLPSC